MLSVHPSNALSRRCVNPRIKSLPSHLFAAGPLCIVCLFRERTGRCTCSCTRLDIDVLNTHILVPADLTRVPRFRLPLLRWLNSMVYPSVRHNPIHRRSARKLARRRRPPPHRVSLATQGLV